MSSKSRVFSAKNRVQREWVKKMVQWFKSNLPWYHTAHVCCVRSSGFGALVWGTFGSGRSYMTGLQVTLEDPVVSYILHTS